MKTTRVAFLSAVLLVAMAPASFSTPVIFSFETYPQLLDVQFGAWGLIFEKGGSIRSSSESHLGSSAHSGEFLVVGPDLGYEAIGFPSHDGDLELTFTSPQSLVQLYGRTNCPSNPGGTLTAFNGLLPVAVDAHPQPPGAYQADYSLFSVTATPATITRVTFKGSGSGGDHCDEFIDDLLIEGDPPPPPPGPPTIVLTTPLPANADFTAQPVVASGTISGSQLFSDVRIDLAFLNPTSGPPFTVTTLFPLSQTSGTSIPFSFTAWTAPLPIGSYRLTATVKNLSGQESQAVVDFSNFPSYLVGSEAQFGPFRFAIIEPNCQMLFYTTTAIAHTADPNRRFQVPIAIAEKWRSVDSQMLGGNRRLGCPNAADVPVPGWRVQDFERGRIYFPASGPLIYVPQIFVRASAALAHSPGGLAEEFVQLGWPVADPDFKLEDDNPTWLHQRFAQNQSGPDYQNTLEVRGRAPKLFIERIGGDARELEGALQMVAKDRGDLPTIWQSIRCPKAPTELWPTDCIFGDPDDPDNVVLPHPPYVRGLPVDGSTCGGQYGLNSGTPNWVSLSEDRPGSYLRYVKGLIKGYDGRIGPAPGSHRAHGDNPLTHKYCNTAGAIASEAGGIFLTAASCAAFASFGGLFGGSGCAAGIVAGVDFLADGRSCPSDWNIHMRPLPPDSDPTVLPFTKNWDVLTVNNILSGDFEIEFEAKYAEQYFDRFLPYTGDLVIAHGRHISDCGHLPYNAEIHPPDSMVVIRSVTGPGGGGRSTGAYIWANGFFHSDAVLEATNGGLAEFTIFGPPRPTPRSILKVLCNEPGYSRKHNLTVSRTPVTGGMVIRLVKNDSDISKSYSVKSTGAQWYYDADESGEPRTKFVDYCQLSWREP